MPAHVKLRPIPQSHGPYVLDGREGGELGSPLLGGVGLIQLDRNALEELEVKLRACCILSLGLDTELVTVL